MKVRLCEIVCDSDKMLEGWETVLKNKSAIKDYAYILHDKDNTRPHYHIAIRLKDSYDTKYVASWFGIGENFVNKVKGRWSDMLEYLTHRNASDKHQYDDGEVVSNFDWQKTRDDKINVRSDEIINGIVSGEIREYNYFEYITPYEYVKYNSLIEKGYKYRADMLKGVNREMEVTYITGVSGSGKTTYAKKAAVEKGYSVFISSGSNDVLDGYKGEDCIILDDLRPSCMGLSDLLKMLDNNTSSTVKSRYRNKVLECRWIIITSVLPLETFYAGVFENEDEPIVQFKRRCSTYINMDMEKIYFSMYNSNSRDYELVGSMDNYIAEEFKKEELTVDNALDRLSNMFGDMSKMTVALKNDGFRYMFDKVPFDDDKDNK